MEIRFLIFLELERGVVCICEGGGGSLVTSHDQTRGGLTRVPSSEAWIARSEVLKQGAPQQPRPHKSNNTSHSPQNNPNKHQRLFSLQIWRHVQKYPVPLVPPKSRWDHPTARSDTPPGGAQQW